MTSEGLGEMFEGDSADTCAGKFPLMSMGAEWRVSRAQTRERGPHRRDRKSSQILAISFFFSLSLSSFHSDDKTSSFLLFSSVLIISIIFLTPELHQHFPDSCYWLAQLLKFPGRSLPKEKHGQIGSSLPYFLTNYKRFSEIAPANLELFLT